MRNKKVFTEIFSAKNLMVTNMCVSKRKIRFEIYKILNCYFRGKIVHVYFFSLLIKYILHMVRYTYLNCTT